MSLLSSFPRIVERGIRNETSIEQYQRDFMKHYFSGLMVIALLAGCATSQQVAQLEGQGTRRVFAATYAQAWRAAVDAAQTQGLQVRSSDPATGYISAGREIQLNTFGENVGIWVKEISPGQTQVEVLSRQAGPPVLWLKNWEKRILSAVAANLSRDVGNGSPVIREPSGAEIRRDIGPDPDLVLHPLLPD